MKILSSLLVFGAFSISLPLDSKVLMFDFGPTAPTGSARTNSMYHSQNSSFVDEEWNQIGVSDVSTLFWSDGSEATDIELRIGATTQHNTSVVALNSTPSGNNVLGNEVNTGIYSGTSVATDGIFTGNSGNMRFVGIQVSGLEAGDYEVYVTSRNTNTASAHFQNIFVGATDLGGDFDANTLSYSGTLGYGDGEVQTEEWLEGGNFIKFTVTVEEGEYLCIAVVGDEAGSIRRGFLNAIQIVSLSTSSKGTVIMLSSLDR